jgi:hypothetical protein
MTNTTAVVAFLGFAPLVFVTAVVAAVESRRRTTDLPTLDDCRAVGAMCRELIASALETERPRTRVDTVRDLAWVVVGPALAVRLMLHVGAAVAIRGGDPGDIDGRRVVASPVVDINPFEGLQLRFATLCYALFWLLMGTQNMDAAGRVFFAVQLSVLLIDPCLWAGARVLSPTESENMTTHNETEDGAQATGGAD